MQSQLDFYKKSNSGSEKRVPATDKSDKNFRNTYRKYFHENWVREKRKFFVTLYIPERKFFALFSANYDYEYFDKLDEAYEIEQYKLNEQYNNQEDNEDYY